MAFMKILTGFSILVLLFPIMLIVIGSLSAVPYLSGQIILEKKISKYLGGQEQVEIPASELFDFKETDFVCLFRYWSDARPAEAEQYDHTALVEADVNVTDIADYVPSFFQLASADSADSHLMALSPEKQLRILRRLSPYDRVQLSDNSNYGCFSPSKTITISKKKTGNKDRYVLQF